MRARHFFITSQDDYIFAAMLGLTDLDPAAGSERIERLSAASKASSGTETASRTLAQVLVLGGSDDGIIDRVLALRDTLRARKIRLDKTYTLPVMGVLAMLPVETDRIARDIAAIQDTLGAQKGFGVLSVPTQELLLYAASIAASEYAKNVKDGVLTAALSTSVTNIIIAQRAAMIAAVSASTAASSASCRFRTGKSAKYIPVCGRGGRMPGRDYAYCEVKSQKGVVVAFLVVIAVILGGFLVCNRLFPPQDLYNIRHRKP